MGYFKLESGFHDIDKILRLSAVILVAKSTFEEMRDNINYLECIRLGSEWTSILSSASH
jgi:hypothetical protein